MLLAIIRVGTHISKPLKEKHSGVSFNFFPLCCGDQTVEDNLRSWELSKDMYAR